MIWSPVRTTVAWLSVLPPSVRVVVLYVLRFPMEGVVHQFNTLQMYATPRRLWQEIFAGLWPMLDWTISWCYVLVLLVRHGCGSSCQSSLVWRATEVRVWFYTGLRILFMHYGTDLLGCLCFVRYCSLSPRFSPVNSPLLFYYHISWFHPCGTNSALL